MTDRIEILNGNELIIQGGLEAGFSLYTGYPGSPLADYFNILYQRKKELQEKGIKVVIANSEANAAAMASGAKQAGRDCLVAMKSMGLHVASDALSVGNFADPGESSRDPNTGEVLKPGVVIAVGDDPWSISTSTPADSRYLFKHLHIPFLEPSTPQELKDWIGKALTISRRSSVYQGVLLTTFMAEGGGRVELGEEAFVSRDKVDIDPSEFDLSKLVMVPPNSLKADVAMVNQRFPKVKEILKELNLDSQFGQADGEVGVISSGVIFETVKQVMEEADYLESLSLYKVACSFPLVDELLLPWLEGKKVLIVIEEKRGFLETEIKELCQRHHLSLKIWGKQFEKKKDEWVEGFPAYGGLNFELVRDKLALGLEILGLTPNPSLCFDFPQWENPLPRRLPTFCPGCPHRETLSLLKDLRKTLKEKKVDLISHGDVGCYSLSFLPPFKEMHNLSAMGQGGALGAGMDLFTNNPSVVLMGDSTFFHSGMTDISNSVQMDHNITYILLDNDNTAMTGHQMTPSTGENVEGRKRPEQDMLRAVQALGVETVIEVDPSDRYFYQNVLQDFIERPGVKVIVSDKECALTFHGRQKAHERKLFSTGSVAPKKTFYQINTDSCEDCRVCVESTGCPGLTQVFDAYGSKVAIDPQICVGDSYCTKIKACPSFEKVDVFHFHPTKWKKQEDFSFDIEELSLPVACKTFEDIAKGESFRVVVTGVGGSGVTTISRVLAEAAREMGGREDLDFKFVDQKGLAQRNGNVTGHLAIYAKGKSYGAVTPRGTADLLLSPDLLDGSQHIGFVGKQGLALLDEKFQVPLSLLLDRGELAEPISEEELKQKFKNLLGEKGHTFSFKEISGKALGRSVYASAMLLGTAFQSGKLPFALQDMHCAFQKTMKAEELDNNWLAFELGRKIWLEKEAGKVGEFLQSLGGEGFVDTLKLFEQSIEESLLPWQNKKTVLKFYQNNLKRLVQYFPEIKKLHLAQYLHDLYIFDRGRKSEEFLIKAGEVAQLYSRPDLKAMALRTLAKTFFIKDEIFISHMMISPMKRHRDRQLYGGWGSTYWLSYINRPSFDIMGMKLEFDLHPKTWMLKMMRHMRLLRWVLSRWHDREKKMALQIRRELTGDLIKREDLEKRQRLKELENIKGYREVRYQRAEVTL